MEACKRNVLAQVEEARVYIQKNISSHLSGTSCFYRFYCIPFVCQGDQSNKRLITRRKNVFLTCRLKKVSSWNEFWAKLCIRTMRAMKLCGGRREGGCSKILFVFLVNSV